MKMIKKTTAVLASIAAVVAMTACSSDSSSGGGGGSSSLATGGFIKSVGINPTGGTTVPFNASPIHIQNLLLAKDINGSGYIDSITYSAYWAEPDTTCSDITFKIGHTSLSALGTTFALNVEEGKGTLETVFTGTLMLPAVAAQGDLVTVALDTPFYYNGVDNVVIDVINTGGCDNTFDVDYSSAVANSMLYTFAPADATGTVDAFTQNMALNFAGGDDKINIDGVDTGFFFPFSVNTASQKTQMLYTSSEINGSGPITGFAYKVGTTTTVDQEQTITVRMGHTTKTAIANGDTFADNFTNSVEVIKDANFTIPANVAVGDYVWVPIAGSFNYNGTDNLIVEVDVTAAATTEEFNPASNTVDVTGRRICGASGSTVADGGCGSDVLYISKFRFNGSTMDFVTDGSATWSVPFNGTGAYTTQMLYSAHALGTSGPIKEVSFRLRSDSAAADYANATIEIAHTTATSLSTTLSDNYESMTTVSTGTLSIPAGLKAGDWITFPVSGFTYDATQNLIIQISQDAGGSDNAICATNADLPGASGVNLALKGDNTAFNATAGDADLRLLIKK